MRPIKRSKLRIAIGKLYYTFMRYLEWYFGKKKFANVYERELLPHIVFTHKTPLIRNLKDVDMWLQYNKIVNLQIATKKIDGLVINPGETFSYWKTIGKPTKRKGYMAGIVLHYGAFKPGIGGGLCQLSNLIYWMTLHTPLTITERYRHSYDVFPDSNRTQPFGSGATCVYNYRDLRVYNGTQDPYQLHIYLADGYLMGEWRSTKEPYYRYKVYEKDHWITHEYWGGYVRHNYIYRKKYGREDVLIEDEYITENHAIMMYQPFLEDGK